MRAQNKFKNYDFELDLAPLLAVMVKLVPVLLISSAFVQLSIIETSFSNSVNNAIARNQSDENKESLTLLIDENLNIELKFQQMENESTYQIKSLNQTLNKVELNKRLVEIKKKNPQLFVMTISPKEKVKYEQIVKIMDLARIDTLSQEMFTFIDPLTKKIEKTQYMFPKVVLSGTEF